MKRPASPSSDESADSRIEKPACRLPECEETAHRFFEALGSIIGKFLAEETIRRSNVRHRPAGDGESR